MNGCKRWGAAALVSFTLFTGANAAATSTEMLREMFRMPVTEWKQTLKANSRLINEEFFSNIDKRVRWGIENNHVDDAFRFAMVGDFAAEAVNRPANYRIDLAELFFKAENAAMTGQIVDNILISSPGSPPAYRAQFLRGRLYEMQKDLFNAYLAFKELADKRYLPEETWFKCGQISLFIGEEARGREELTKAAAAGSQEAGELLARLEQQNNAGWDSLEPIANSPGDNTMPDTANSRVNNPDANSTAAVDPGEAAEDPLSQGRLAVADNRLDDALAWYASVFDPQDPQGSREYGAVLYRTGDLGNAKAIFDQAIARNPDDAELLRARANVLERMYDREGKRDNLSAAIADYSQATSLAPDHGLLNWELARARSKD